MERGLLPVIGGALTAAVSFIVLLIGWREIAVNLWTEYAHVPGHEGWPAVVGFAMFALGPWIILALAMLSVGAGLAVGWLINKKMGHPL
jgi:hypothetical protein